MRMQVNQILLDILGTERSSIHCPHPSVFAAINHQSQLSGLALCQPQESSRAVGERHSRFSIHASSSRCIHQPRSGVADPERGTRRTRKQRKDFILYNLQIHNITRLVATLSWPSSKGLYQCFKCNNLVM